MCGGSGSAACALLRVVMRQCPGCRWGSVDVTARHSNSKNQRVALFASSYGAGTRVNGGIGGLCHE